MTLPTFLTDPDPSMYRRELGNAVVLDFETTNIENGTALNKDNRLVLSCWRDRDGGHYSWNGEMDLAPLVRACNDASFLIAHNAKFELQWLQRCGFDISTKPVYDTMVGEWVLQGNRPAGILASLDDCLERRGMAGKMSIVSRMIKAGVCPSEIPRSWLLRYCQIDVDQTLALMERQLEEMEGTRLLPIVYTRCLTTPALADIEWNGLHLDKERVEKEYNETVEQYNAARAKMDILTGGINPGSPPQVATFVYGKLGFEEAKDKSGTPIRNKPTKQFPDGLPKTDEATLLSLRATTDDQREFIELRKELAHLTNALSKNLEMFVGACRENDGMIYGQLNQCTTKTHRLSSSGRSTKYNMFPKPKGCQFQNLPRAYKGLFSPRHKDWLIAEADGSQLEFRVAGHIGDDDVIRKEVREGYDVHRYTASIINQVPEAQVTKEQRTDAKPDTFKPLYGGQSGTKGQRRYYASFQEKYSSLNATQEGWCVEVESRKGLETEWGMRFYWPNARMTGWKQDYHDSIEAEFPPNERELFEETAVQSLTHDVYQYLDTVYDVQFSVPLGVGILVGKHWGEPLDGEDEVSIQVETPFVGEANYE